MRLARLAGLRAAAAGSQLAPRLPGDASAPGTSRSRGATASDRSRGSAAGRSTPGHKVCTGGSITSFSVSGVIPDQAFCLLPTVAMWVQAGSGMLPSEAGGLQPGQDTQRVPQPLPPRLADAAEGDGLRGAGGAAVEAFDDLLADMQAQAAEGVDNLPRWLGTQAVRSRPGTSACALQQ